MRYVAAYMLAVLGGKQSPSIDDIKKILGSVGIEANDDKMKKIIGDLSGKSIDTLIAEGREKLCSMPVGGGAAVAVAVADSGAAPAAEEKKESKKEEKKEESDEDDDDMGFGLFD